MQNRIIFLTCSFFISGCTIAKDADNNKQFQRLIAYRVQSNLFSDPKSCSYSHPQSSGAKSYELQMVKYFLAKEDLIFTKADAKCDLTVDFAIEKPPLYFAIGTISPYRHTMKLSARGPNNKEIWTLSVSGPNEYADRRKVTAYLLAASKGFVNDKSLQNKEVSLYDDDTMAVELLNHAGIKDN